MRPFSRVAVVVGYGALFLALAGLLFFFTAAITRSIGPLRLFNSDAVQAFMMTRDVLAAPGDILRWYHPPNMFPFPDWLFAGALVLAPIPFTYLPLVYPGLIVASYCFAIAAVLRAARVSSFRLGLAAGIAFFALLFGLAASNTDWMAQRHVFLLLPPFWHTGALFAGLLTIAALSAWARAPHRPWLKWSALALAPVAGYSDALYLAWFALPLVVAAGLQAFALRRWRPARLSAVMAILAGLGNLPATFRDVRYPPCSFYDLNVGTLDRIASAAFRQGDAIMLAVGGLLIAMAVRGLQLVVRCLRRSPLSPVAYVELMLIGASLAAAIIPNALGCVFNEELTRYSLPVFVCPFLWVVLVFFGRVGPAYRVSATGAAAALAVVIWVPLAPFDISKVAAVTKSPLSVCLDRPGGGDGIGDYWTAKRVMFETDYRIHIVQLRRNAHPMRFNYNGRWFRMRAGDGGALRPTYIVMTRLDPGAIRRKFGAPARTETCAGQVIWRYDRPLSGFDRP